MSTISTVYPLLTWERDYAATLAVSVRDGGGTPVVENLALSGTRWGWGVSSGVATSTSLADLIADTLDTHTLISAVAPIYTATTTAAVNVSWSVTITTTATQSSAPTLAIVSTSERYPLGILSATLTATGSGTSWTFTSEAYFAGIWTGHTDACEYDPNYSLVWRQQISQFNPASRTVANLATRTIRSLKYRNVLGRYLQTVWASNNLYAAQAGTNVLDVQSTVQQLIADVLATASPVVRIYTAADAYDGPSRPTIAEDPSVLGFATKASVGGRRWDVTFDMVDE